MTTVLAVSAELVAVVAVVVLFQGALILLRNPRRPRWLRFAEGAIAVAFVAAITVSLAALTAGLIAAGMHAIAAVVLALLFPILAGRVSARVIDLKGRIARAEGGG